jgi:hypothetical protein
MFQNPNISSHRRNLSPRAAAPPVSEKKFKVEACCLMAVRRAILILLSDQE